MFHEIMVRVVVLTSLTLFTPWANVSGFSTFSVQKLNSRSLNRRGALILHRAEKTNGSTDDAVLDAVVSPSSIDQEFPKGDSTATAMTSGSDDDPQVIAKQLGSRILAEAKEVMKCTSIVFGYLSHKKIATANDIVELCDEIEAVQSSLTDEERELLVTQLELREKALKFGRYEMLQTLMKEDYEGYVATASFLSPSRIPREELPNVQDVPYPNLPVTASSKPVQMGDDGEPLVEDCTLDDMAYNDSILDTVLLKIFRNLVEKNTGGVSSSKEGILGLLEQGRIFMTQPNQTPEGQHTMVKDTLRQLMTPVLPPFYRIFMGGIVPNRLLNKDADEPSTQIGPWFYAPWLTSFVTPIFFGFLVGPSRPNSRKDGQAGGLVVEKCKFLQESGCKGLCLHICKLPTQQFFQDELGVPLTVTPNFETQECQWSFGEVPLTPAEDPSFPKGCLVGCQSRELVKGTQADLCN
uniref:Beta-carotene isomerase D27-like C-terminal domain-containing protein n=1 Tax=Attheya septentrionalis TaxID=420275 RepID=A0A7S2XLF3_9STRA|mmetsp:Transcript_18476/g.33459  ORF Transcript_18476/g.33459 Transcript_18476/m.33459 type:complete len:466 (+) Transcript_18476:231-1628(+)